jgi:hypothetical protein
VLRAGQWADANGHFSTAARINQGFTEGYLALAMSLAYAQRFAEAVAPVEKYAKIAVDDPACHYQLAIALRPHAAKAACDGYEECPAQATA